MHAKDAILFTYALSERIVDLYLSDLSNADLLVKPFEDANSIAWQLGHLLLSEQRMVDGIRPGTSPPLPEGFADAYPRDAEAKAQVDPGAYLTKEKYIELMKTQRAATKALLADLSDAELGAPGPEQARAMAPTNGALLTMVGNHVMMHVGQFASVRRALKKPVVI